MADAPPHPELLSALGRLVRGLSLLFWGLPIALVVCVQTARGDWFRPLGVVPPMVATALLLYGLYQLAGFQRQERPWRSALDRAILLALINVGLSPFLYWSNRVPSHAFLNGVVETLMISGTIFLLLLNPLLCRLTAMLPDETLRLETRLFTTINRCLLLVMLVILAAYFAVLRVDPALPSRMAGWLAESSPLPHAPSFLSLLDHADQWFLLFFVLLPLAMTMALIWKIKEVILTSVFGPGH